MTYDENEIKHLRAELLGSLLKFTQVFYKIRTGRDFSISCPVSRESHYITICRELTDVFYSRSKSSIINIPPRYGKTELVIHFVAWSFAHYADCNFLYTSYAKEALADKATQTIREIMQLPAYKKLFNVEISQTTKAKDNFETTAGGSVYAAGTGGTITGRGAGIKYVTDRFSGAFIIDDAIKPDEATSDTIRERCNNWFFNTAQSRLNNPEHTPILLIGQRTHENDICNLLMQDKNFNKIIIPVLDAHKNALDERIHTKEKLLEMQEKMPYDFAAQYMQNPQPAGGGIFKPEWFLIKDEEPQILATFITVDTAETDKNYNDATVFSFWGLYKIQEFGVDIDKYALHWLACDELRVEPKDLEAEFRQFYASCMRYKVKPKLAAIEKKSSGTTLLSVLSSFQGIQILDIERTKASGNKTSRFLEIQQYIANKQISFTRYAEHADKCIEHCRKITANNTHRFDDIADTLYDAVKLALIDKTIQPDADLYKSEFVNHIVSQFNRTSELRRAAYAHAR